MTNEENKKAPKGRVFCLPGFAGLFALAFAAILTFRTAGLFVASTWVCLAFRADTFSTTAHRTMINNQLSMVKLSRTWSAGKGRSKCLITFVCPRTRSIDVLAILSRLARNSIRALFAFPSRGGAVTLILTELSSNQPTTLVCFEFG